MEMWSFSSSTHLLLICLSSHQKNGRPFCKKSFSNFYDPSWPKKRSCHLPISEVTISIPTIISQSISYVIPIPLAPPPKNFLSSQNPSTMTSNHPKQHNHVIQVTQLHLHVPPVRRKSTASNCRGRWRWRWPSAQATTEPRRWNLTHEKVWNPK